MNRKLRESSQPKKQKPMKYAKGGPVSSKETGTARGMGAATKGGKFHKMG